MLNAIKAQMEQQFAVEGIVAEVTFISKESFSLFCEDAQQFCKAKALLDAAKQDYDSESCDPEIGFFAYYNF